VIAPATTASRYDFLDWLRVIAIAILLVYHTGMLFVGWDFHIQNPETIDALARPMDFSHRLRMPLLFVIAGAGMWLAARRRSAASLMGERTRRLLVPVVFGMLVIVPPQLYIERLFDGQWRGGYWQFYFERVLQFVPYPAGNFSWHHLWFIVYLFIYVPLLLPVLSFLKRTQNALKPGVWVYALALPLGLNEALLRPHFPVTHALIDDWYVFVHYLLFTLYGLMFASCEGVWDWLARERRRALAIAVAVTTLALSLLDTGILPRGSVYDAFLANAFTWCWLLVFLAFGRAYLSRANGFLRWARDASYPIYILHQSVMLVIAYWVIAQSWAPWTKFFAVLATTAAGSVLIYEVCVRRFAITRLLFGMRSLPPRGRDAEQGVPNAFVQKNASGD
jgi:glucan biosynthesis protein C